MSYGQPPPPNPYGGQPYGGPPAGPPPSNNLVWAILSTLLCCLPLGVVSIVFAAQVNGKWQSGDQAGAHDAANKAKNFAIASAVVGLVVILGYIILVVAVGVGTT
ncbi:CD225/dispanin family protein [Nocardioides sp.]|uniref:CD225/dispanin family protein n=1 Tax=Nocardioides sp. TaxID=35761 RepID=UPI002717CC1C|nr:CD225/dispanin family protein [Nocardioides sp.]MDO9455099.1 CD225/dispanin family protein [Nocardioides sp.]